jgi:hypothetical protein
MNDSLLMGVLDPLADLNEEGKTLRYRQSTVIAVFRDPDAADELHYEVGATFRCGTRVEHSRHVGVIHKRECLALSLEARNDGLRIHPGLDDLDRNFTFDWSSLLSEVRDAATPFAKFV